MFYILLMHERECATMSSTEYAFFRLICELVGFQFGSNNICSLDISVFSMNRIFWWALNMDISTAYFRRHQLHQTKQ